MTQFRRILWLAVSVATCLLIPQRAAAQLVYASSPDANAVFVIDPGTTSVLTTIPTTFSPGAIAVTPDGQFAYVAANCSPADHLAGTAGTVSVIDLVKNVVLTPPITVGVCPNGIAIGTTANGVRVYVSNGSSPIGPGFVSVIDPTNNVVATINVGNMIAGSGSFVKTSGVVLTPDASRLLVTGYFTNGEPVLTIDTATNGFTSLPGGYTSFIFTGDFALEAPVCTIGLLAYIPSGFRAYVPDTECDAIYDVVNSGVVDPLTGAPGPGIAKTFGVNLSGVNAIAISPDGLRGYVSGGILGTNSKATATASLGAAGSVASVSITYGGNGYAAPPAVTFVSQDAITPPGFAPATGVATVLNGAVSSVTVTNGGSGYGNPPLVEFGSAGVGVFNTANDSSLPSIGLAAAGAQGVAVAEPANTPLNPAALVSFENIVQVTGNVTTAGSTTASYLGSNCPPAPGGFQFGNPPVCYHISSTATFSGSALVCITDPSITSGSKLFHYQNGWTDITNVPVTPPMICGTTNSFSPFAILQPTAQTSTTSTSISTTNVTYGTPANATVSVNSSGGTVSGNVTLSVDGGAASSMTLTGGSATFNLGTLSAGNHSLAATFAAQGSFQGSSANSVLVVTPAPLTLTANSASRPYGANNPVLAPPLIAGVQNGDVISSNYSIAATPASPVGNYPVVPMASGASNVLSNYNISFVNGTLTILPANTSLAISLSPVSMAVGQATTATITLTAPDMVIPIDPGVLTSVTLSSPVTSDILSNNGMCMPMPSATPGLASCTITVTAVEPNGRTLLATFPGSADLAASNSSASNTGNLIVTAALQSQQVCIASDFRNVAVPGGSYVWFSSIFKVRDATKQLIHVSFYKSSVQFQYADPARNAVSVNQKLPDAQITIDPNATTASTSFDAINSVWITTIPWDLDDNSFLTGMPWLVPSAGLPADVEPVTVCGTFASDVANVDIGWRWAAAAYSSFSTDNTTLGVKPMDTDHDNQATNHDRAGTPENYKQFVIPGARGKGGKNYTGTYSRSAVIE